MDKVYIGKYINTHGLKGEIRIKSDITFKSIAFIPGNKVIIDDNEYEIESYRVHKDLDMLKFVGIKHLEQIESLKGSSVYIDRSYLGDILIDTDLIGMSVISKNKTYGKVTSIEKGTKYDYIKVNNKYLVPKIDEFILNIDKDIKKIEINYIKGLFDEN